MAKDSNQELILDAALTMIGQRVLVRSMGGRDLTMQKNIAKLLLKRADQRLYDRRMNLLEGKDDCSNEGTCLLACQMSGILMQFWSYRRKPCRAKTKQKFAAPAFVRNITPYLYEKAHLQHIVVRTRPMSSDVTPGRDEYLDRAQW